ncbi:hypothetical protein ACFL6H_02940 [Candidatus Latescibacterota bacterium]
MLSLFKIWTVAVFEIKTLARSWFFRIFSLLAILILILLNVVFFVSRGSAMWTLRGIPSSIPYMNLLLLNVAQAIIGIFMASDFFKFDKKLDTTDVIYIRSMTNADYVFGKTLGVFVLFFSLNILVLLLAFIFNFFFADIPVVPISYLYYPLFISIPTLTFIFGLSFLCMVVLRSQAITFIILLGYIATTLFILGNKFHYLFDYMTFNVPLMFSDFIGFGDITSILIHRGIYLFLGIGFILITVLFIKRLPQSRYVNKICLVLSITLIISALYLGKTYIARINNGIALRTEMRELAQKYVEEPKLSITDLHLDLIHNEDTIEVNADILFRNDTSSGIDSYIFSLNPDLAVQKVERNGTSLSFDRDLHILIVDPGSTLMPGEGDNISIFYRGSINEEANYIDISEELREEKYRIFVYNIDKRYGFVTPEYVLLTHENLWYPTSGVPFGSAYPKTQGRDLINFELTVKTDAELTAMSQGSRTFTSGSGEFSFKPEVPMPQLSLIIGKYEEKTLSIEDMDYSIFVLNGHDYFSEYFTDIGETLPELITEYKQDYERNLKLDYPYKRFSFIEVPIQFYSYDRLWTLSHETIQPEQILLPEKAILFMEADFKRSTYSQNRRGGGGFDRGGGTRSPEEIQTDMFRRFLSATVGGNSMLRRISRMMRDNMGGSSFNVRNLFSSMLPSSVPSYDIFPNFYSFTNHFYSEEWPVFNISLENYLRAGIGGFNFFGSFSGLSNVEAANIALSRQTLTEIIADPDQKDIVYDVINNKADYLFALIKAEIGDEEFEEFLYEILKESRFKKVNTRDFIDRMKERFGFDLESYFDRWTNERRLPVFYCTDINCIEILEDEATMYYITFKVYNPEPVGGIISAGFNTLAGGGRGMGGGGRGGGGRGGGGFMMFGAQAEPMEFYYILEGNQAKEIGIVIDNAPRSIRFNTFISQNLPATFDKELPRPELVEDAVISEGEKILAQPPALNQPGVIIVDNEDPGFEVYSQVSESLLLRMIDARNASVAEEYIGFNLWHPPNTWRATVQNDFYGLFKHSAYFIQSGAGDQKVTWQAEIAESGRYDIFYYTPEFNQLRRMMRGGRGGRNRNNGLDDLNFMIYHDDGIAETVLIASDTEEEWSYLGTYYLSEGSAKVELSNKSKGRVIYADAVKWSLNR